MTMSAQFNEKVFEENLKYELLAGPGQLWSPDTVLEKQLGVDGVLEAKVALWTLLGRPPVPGLNGLYIAGFMPGGVDDQGLSGVGFQANLLMQAKCSHWFTYRNKIAKAHGWTAPYWCFQITPHQQKTLTLLATHCGASALVTYASPAFHMTADLLAHARAGTLVANTTWPVPAALTGHRRWLYAAGGSSGVPNPDYEYLYFPPIAERVAAAFDRRRDSNDRSITHLWGRLREALTEAPELLPWGPAFVRRADGLVDAFERRDAVAFASVQATFEILGLNWLVIGGERES